MRVHLKSQLKHSFSQSIAKWLSLPANERLLCRKFQCIRYSKSKGFILLQRVTEDENEKFILYVDMMGVMDTYTQNLEQWIKDTFNALSPSSSSSSRSIINTSNNNNNTNNNKSESTLKLMLNSVTDAIGGNGTRIQRTSSIMGVGKIIHLKQLYDVLQETFGEESIKVIDKKALHNIIEFRVCSKSNKLKSPQMASLYNSVIYIVLSVVIIHSFCRWITFLICWKSIIRQLMRLCL